MAAYPPLNFTQPQQGYQPVALTGAHPPHPQARGQQPAANLPMYKGEVPGEDVHESSGKEPAAPSAPPASSMDHIAGYERVNFKGDVFIPPPAYAQAPATAYPGQSSDIKPNIPTISEETARIALMEEVSDHCCYGKGPIEDLTFVKIQPSSAFHYQLESFAEGRTTTWAYEPYTGQPVDGPMNGHAPAPWDIAAQPNGLFSDHQKVFEIPHTASVKLCHNCRGIGMNRCWRCCGRGRVVCGRCNGSGRTASQEDTGGSVSCTQCSGSGRKKCWTCHGYGQLECQLCHMRGQLKCYIKLTVAWKTHKNDHIVERTALPDHLIRGAQGQEAFKDQRPRVAPVTTFPEQSVNDASQRLVNTHSTAFPSERILMQRHWIRIVPVSEVQCDYKGKGFTYWVYGHNSRVYNPDYPQKCCWGCTVL